MSQYSTDSVAGSPTTVIQSAPISLTDFTDTKLWVPIGAAQATRVISASGMVVSGTGAGDLTFFSGIALRGVVYGDPIDGEITIEHRWDSYVRPSDLILGKRFLFGVNISFEAVAENTILSGYGGMGSLTTHDDFRNGVLTTSGIGSAFASFSQAVPAVASFIIINMIRNAAGGFFDMAYDFGSLKKDGEPTELAGAFGASRRTVTFGPSSGARLRFGLFADRRSAVSTARLILVKIVKGQFVAD